MMYQPPKEKKVAKIENLLGASAPDKTDAGNDAASISRKGDVESSDKSETVNADLNLDEKITNTDEKNETEGFVYQ